MPKRLRQMAAVSQFLAAESLKFFGHRPHALGTFYAQAWYASRNGKLPRRKIEEVFPGIEDAELELHGLLHEQDGNVWGRELGILAGICRFVGPRCVFEFGTFTGRTTINLAANTPPDAVVYTLDIPHDHPKLLSAPEENRYLLEGAAGRFYKHSRYEHKVRQLWGDSAEFDPSALAERVDLVFVDGSHSYDYVQNDTEKALKMLAPNGTLVWHDYYYGWPDVAAYLHERADDLEIIHIEGTSLALSRPAREARREGAAVATSGQRMTRA